MKSDAYSFRDRPPRSDRLDPIIETARATLRSITPHRMAAHSGGRLNATGDLHIEFLWREYVITSSAFKVQQADTHAEPSSFIQAILLTYLATADGTPPSDRWISFHDLPEGMFYERAFQSYSGAELIRQLRGDVETFRRVAPRWHGESLDMGDAGFAFRVLPRLRLAIVLWAGDEDFPAQARVLFEATAPHYLSTEGLAILGGQLVGQLLKAASHEA
jgi:hypothetical protein